MSMGMEIGVFLAYAFALLMVYVFGRFLLIPLKWMAGWIVSSLIGGIVIILINYFGAAYGVFIPLNLITAIITGVLGVPGVVMLMVFFW